MKQLSDTDRDSTAESHHKDPTSLESMPGARCSLNMSDANDKLGFGGISVDVPVVGSSHVEESLGIRWCRRCGEAVWGPRDVHFSLPAYSSSFTDLEGCHTGSE